MEFHIRYRKTDRQGPPSPSGAPPATRAEREASKNAQEFLTRIWNPIADPGRRTDPCRGVPRGGKRGPRRAVPLFLGGPAPGAGRGERAWTRERGGLRTPLRSGVLLWVWAYRGEYLLELPWCRLRPSAEDARARLTTSTTNPNRSVRGASHGVCRCAPCAIGHCSTVGHCVETP